MPSLTILVYKACWDNEIIIVVADSVASAALCGLISSRNV